MQMIIGGKKVDASNGATIPVYNPATLQQIDTVPSATWEDVDLALHNARKGLEVWSKFPLYKRIDVIRAFHKLLVENSQELINLVVAEVGKPLQQGIRCLNTAAIATEQYIEHARCLETEVLPINNRPGVENDMILTVREPLGVVVGILPFNYPITLLTHKVIPALLMGNAVIIKPASETPLADIRFIDLLLESGVPADALQIVTGSGRDIGKWLSEDPRVDAIDLTGSTEVGIEIAKNSAKHLHKVFLELGGNDAMVVLEDADLDLAVSESIASRLANAGQTCCSTKRCIVHNSVKEAFIEKLILALDQKKLGDPSLPETDCGPLVSVRAAKTVEEQVALTIEQGAVLRYGGKRFNETFFQPTVLEVTPSQDVAHDLEIFGPVWSVMGFDTLDEAIALANDTQYGLSSCVMGKDIHGLMKIAKGMQAGCCTINGSSFYRSVDQPFGGFKMSGTGREGGRYTLEEMSQLKTIVFKGVYR